MNTKLLYVHKIYKSSLKEFISGKSILIKEDFYKWNVLTELSNSSYVNMYKIKLHDIKSKSMYMLKVKLKIFILHK